MLLTVSNVAKMRVKFVQLGSKFKHFSNLNDRQASVKTKAGSESTVLANAYQEIARRTLIYEQYRKK